MFAKGIKKPLNITILKQEMYNELINILKYWSENCVDTINGGFVGTRNHWNQLVDGAQKGVVLNTRILWTYSAAYNFTHNPEYLKLATRVYEYITKHFIDKKYGGLYWVVDYKGNTLDPRKQIYAQGFGIYGFTEYFIATKNYESLNHAIDLFKLIEEFSYDPKYNGYIEALSEEWKTMNDMRLSEKDANEPKSMNTHLHILEPYTNLLKIWKNDKLKIKIESLIKIFLEKIINWETGHLQLFFKKNWEVRSNIVSYGHDIEGAWLLVEAANELNNQALIKKTGDAALKLVNATIKDGMDTDGSVFYESINGNTDKDKHWWPQAEALTGLVYAWKISGKLEYINILYNTWDFIKKNMIDYKNGEWFWRVNEKRVAITENDKAGFWKCPYHNSRALMETIKNLY